MYEPYQHEINSAVRVQTCSYPAGTHEDALFIHIQFNQQLFHCLTHKQTQKRCLHDMMLNKKGSCCHVPSDLSLIVADKHWSVTFHDWRSESLEMTPEIPQSHVLWITCRQTWPQIDFLICIRNIWKKGENIYIYIYIYRYVCVSLCVKKNPLGGSWSFKFYSLSQLWSYLSGQSLSHSTPSTHLLFLGTKPQEQQLCGDNDFSPLTWCQVLCSPCQSLVVIGVVSSRYRNTKLLVVLPLMYMLGVIDSK